MPPRAQAIDADGVIEMPKSLVGRMAAIMGEMQQLEKSGYNTFFKYKYVQDSDLLEPLRKVMAKYGVVCFSEVLGESRTDHSTRQGTSTLTKLDMRMTLACEGEERSFPWIGYGDDSGDKGAYKAMTGGLKTFLMKVFALSGDEDPERDDEDNSSTGQRGASTHSRTSYGSAVSDGPAAQNEQVHRPVQVQASSVTATVEKGGKSTAATQAQIREIAKETQRLGLSLSDLLSLAKTVTGKGVNLPDDDKEKPTAAQAYFAGLTGEEAGNVLQLLVETERMAPEAAQAAPQAEPEEEAPQWPSDDDLR